MSMSKEFHKIRDQVAVYNIPLHMRTGIIEYLVYGIRTGEFLKQILCNNFAMAARYSDPINKQYFYEYAQFLNEYCHDAAYGSEEKYNAWIQRGGLQGKAVPDEISNLQSVQRNNISPETGVCDNVEVE